jgi:hypothetical protein
MKTRIFNKRAGLAILVTAALLLPLLAGCLRIERGGAELFGSADLETRDYDFSDFRRLSVSHAFQLDISRDDDYRVSATLNENLFEYFDISQSGDRLVIRMRRGFNYYRSTREIVITMPELVEIEFSGATSANVAGFASGDDIRIGLSGASNLEIDGWRAGDARIGASGASRVIGEMDIADGDFDISGASTVDLSGSGNELDLGVSGAGSARLGDFFLRAANARLSGASNGSLDVSGRLSIAISGASVLYYSGDPSIDLVEVSGGATLRQR